MSLTKEELFDEALIGNAEIINDPNVAVFKDSFGRTPLHILGIQRVREVILHPECHSVFDEELNTPLHCLALEGSLSVLEHFAANTVFNKEGITPFTLLIQEHQDEIYEILTKKYDLKVENTPTALYELLNMPSSIKFLFEKED